MDFLTQPPFIDVLAAFLGLCVGSFLNVLALRTLSEESPIWPTSKCPRCQHQLGPLDNIPLLSYLFLGAKCRYCQTSIHWQYPVVEFFTAVIFVAIERSFLDWAHSPFNSDAWNGITHSFNIRPVVGDATPPEWLVWFFIAGALWLACTLIAVTVTDFREKLIPHEITYPSIVIGILFSAVVRQDALGAMAGVGASYILFDFIAFYGLKVYVAMHGGMDNGPSRTRLLRRRLKPKRRRKLNRALRWRLDLATIDREAGNNEQLEVMGGGDAVLSAVMAAFLGWQLLIVALSIGFMAGSLMGVGLLLWEMRKANLLHKCLRKSMIWTVGGATVLGVAGYALGQATGINGTGQVAIWAVFGGMSGLLLAVVSVGSEVSKPYPFGPALAFGGLIAIFLLPNWL